MKESVNKLLSINVSEFVQQKNGLSYLSWSAAWRYFLLEFPDASFTVMKNLENIPMFGNESVGYICYVSVTAGGLTREMYLPVLDGANKPLKIASYKYKTKYGEKLVGAMNMFDINKTIQRALVKCLALFGLGLYIYNGLDNPLESEEEILYQKQQDQHQDLKNRIMTKLNNIDEDAKKQAIVALKADPSLITEEFLRSL